MCENKLPNTPPCVNNSEILQGNIFNQKHSLVRLVCHSIYMLG